MSEQISRLEQAAAEEKKETVSVAKETVEETNLEQEVAEKTHNVEPRLSEAVAPEV